VGKAASVHSPTIRCLLLLAKIGRHDSTTVGWFRHRDSMYSDHNNNMCAYPEKRSRGQVFSFPTKRPRGGREFYLEQSE
jgi:hypothetical protein